jgi:hypothetical protein
MRLPLGIGRLPCWLLAIACVAPASQGWAARPFVPGTGERAVKVGDDFEEEDWKFVFNLPKSSEEQDGKLRPPDGRSKNGRWYEGNKRGCPDVIRRVETPEGGLEGSTGALLLKTRRSGVPGELSGKMEQDDLIVNVRSRLGGYVPMSWSPSIVVRVYLPPLEQWERRTGIHFGFRGDCEAHVTEQGKGLFAREETVLKEFWPGVFLYFTSRYDSGQKKDSAKFLFRAGPQGWDFPGPEIKETGWWTLGLSFTTDGQVHYYVSPGVDDLTEEDYVASQFPYGYKCERLNNFFFNVANQEDGRTWSTEFIIDDPSLYFIRKPQTANAPAKKKTTAAKPTVKKPVVK